MPSKHEGGRVKKVKPVKGRTHAERKEPGSARPPRGAKCENGVQAMSRSRAGGERQNKALAATR